MLKFYADIIEINMNGTANIRVAIIEIIKPIIDIALYFLLSLLFIFLSEIMLRIIPTKGIMNANISAITAKTCSGSVFRIASKFWLFEYEFWGVIVGGRSLFSVE